jgi:hypothetical protein
VQQTLIDGRVYFDRQRDLAARPNLEKERKALLEKEKKAAAAEKKRDGTPVKPGEKKPDEKPKPPSAAVSGGAL